MSRKIKFKFNLIVFFILVIMLIESFIANMVNRTYAVAIPQKYDLTSEISLVVKNQYQNGICPHMSIATVMESHVKLGQKKGKYGFIKKNPVFSVLTAKGDGDYCPVLTDKTEKVLSEIYGSKKTEDDILKIEGVAESSLIVNAMEKLQPDLDVTSGGKRASGNVCLTKTLPAIKKEYNNNSLVYKDGSNNTLTKAQVNEIRAEYKNFIMENGGIRCGVQTVGIKDGSNGSKVCFNKTRTTNGSNHSVVIVGWDDTYSKNNFPASNRPSTDGAYIVQNSWGKDWGTNGKFYVSYEDLYIEDGLTGIEGVTEYKDTSEPEITVKDVGSGKLKINVTDKYSSGVNESSLKYKWTDHNIEPNTKDSSWTSIKNGDSIGSQNNKYLWVYCEDKAGNYELYCSGSSSAGLLISDTKTQCDVWLNKDVQLTIKDQMTMAGINEPFKLSITSTSFTQEEIKNMEKIQDNNDHILTISKEGKHEIYLTKIKDGKECRAVKLNVMIDKTKPSNPEITISNNKESDKYYEGANVTYKAGADTLSGVKGTNIEIKDKDGKNINVDNKAGIILSNIGTYTVKVTTTDNAGNSSSTEKKIEIVKKDNDSKSDDDDNKKDEDSKSDDDNNKKDEDSKFDDDNKKDNDSKSDDDNNKKDEDSKLDDENNKKDENSKSDDENNKRDEDSKSDDENNKKNEDSKSDNNDDEKSGNSEINGNDTSSSKQDNNNGIISNTDSNNSKIQKNDSSKANKMLPATGSDNEYSIIIIIATVVFLILSIYSYKKLKEIE